ncbi:MAG: reverse transcriptase domain-containing protein, partial [Pseudomonadota bacterium]
MTDAAAHATGPHAAEEVHAALEALADLPRRVLAGDGRSSSARARHITARVARMEAGAPLDDEDGAGGAADTSATRRRTLSEDQLLARRIQARLEDGSVTRAARALASLPLADPTSPATIAALRAKHPDAPPPVLLDDDTPALQISAETLQHVLRDLEGKTGKASGPTQLTYEHILAATKASAEALSATLAFVNLILGGELPRHSSLLDSSLVGLRKPDGGVRPIAIGEVWVRLAGLCALHACADAGRDLAPLQLAVGVSGGVEATVHALRASLAEDTSRALLAIDFANAYNSVDRSAVFAAVKRRAPGLLRYAQWSYGTATDLHVVGAPTGTPPIKSSTGVRQGDTLGMFFFALALQGALEEARAAAPDAPTASIADDVNLTGAPDDLRQAYTTLTDAAAAIGLRVQPAKCAITGGQPHEVARLAADLGVQHRPEGVTVCGTPIGTDAYVTDALAARAADVTAMVALLMRLPVAKQSQFVLLRASMAPRMAHLLRTVRWELLEPSTRAVERAVSDAVADIFRLPERGAERARQQMTLPLRHGGLGLRVVQAVEADAALLSGAAKAQAAMLDGPEACRPFCGASRPPLLARWPAVHAFGDPSAEWGPGAVELPDQFVLDTLPLVQTTVSRLVGDSAGAAFLASCDVSTVGGQRDASRLRSAASGHSSAWVSASLAPTTTRLADHAFVMSGRHMLGLGVPSSVGLPPCECGSADSTQPDHALACRCNAGRLTLRHNYLTSVLARIANRAGCAVSKEPCYNHLTASAAPGGTPGQRRGDLLITMPDGRIVVVDVV